MMADRPERIGKYEIFGELGRGGMGVVYKAHDPVIRRDVALKVVRRCDLDPADADAVIERFKREAQAAGNLNHPNIVSIYEYGEDGEYAFIAMECVIGKSLRDHLLAGYRPELRRFPEILDQLLEGLEYSHSRNVIHRDIKPGNLLISEMGVAKISDFGIARLDASHLTMMGEVLGTPYYMSPEQFDGKLADERSDVYSAAVIVYEVLTGRRPFEGQGAVLMRKILEETPKLPSTLEPRLS
jgi:serine/threonine protein kinase